MHCSVLATDGLKVAVDDYLKKHGREPISGEIKSVDKKGSDAQVPEAGTKFAFKLEGFDKDWTYCGNSNTAKLYNPATPACTGRSCPVGSAMMLSTRRLPARCGTPSTWSAWRISSAGR